MRGKTMNNLLTRAQCLECGEIGTHNAGCNTATGKFQIVKGGVVIEHAFTDSDLCDTLTKLQGRNGLVGVSVWLDGKRLTKLQLVDYWLNYSRSFMK